MSIFKRSKDSAGGHSGEADDGRVDDAVQATEALGGQRSDGPWDVAEVNGRDGRVDLGALWVRGVPGMELRLEVDQASQQVNAATAVLGESALQMQAFAAPRSGELWDEIRAEIAAAVEGQGGTAEEHEGELGTLLRTRMPSQGPDGRTVFAPATFVGVDGPRWFLRAVLSGRAAIDEGAAAPLVEVLQGGGRRPRQRADGAARAAAPVVAPRGRGTLRAAPSRRRKASRSTRSSAVPRSPR